LKNRTVALLVAAALTAALAAAPAFGAFPLTRSGGNTHDYADLYLGNSTPNDLGGDGNEFKFAATPDPSNGIDNARPTELGGVRGAHLADADSSVNTAMKLTLGRPDVEIAVLDSGIKWNDGGAMSDLRLKVHINKGELPIPLADLGTAISNPGTNNCGSFTSAFDANGDGVFNIDDYACDSRVKAVLDSDPRRNGPAGVLVPEDLTLAFSDGTDADGNGFIDDVAGWDFVDDDNDPYDDVQYGHGTGEAKDSSSEGDNGGQLGSCPNCTVLPLRVGESFIADVNRFAAAVLYATDNGVSVVQEALGATDNSSLARSAVDYAYRHDVTVIASAADEAAQHNNWPSSLPHVILVNSITTGAVPAPDQQYTAFNGCTNFNAKITLAIPSTSCSSNATGLASGMAGLIYSAALNAKAKGALTNYPDTSQCRRTNDQPCVVTPNEVRQLMASGKISGAPQADDIDFAGSPAGSANEPSCSPVALAGCTDPNGALQAQVDLNRPVFPPAAFQSYPARKGFDQFYGYGRVNMFRAVSAVLSDPASPATSKIPPEAEITSPEWFEQVDSTKSSLQVDGQVFARGSSYTCDVLVAPGQYPNNAKTGANPPGDFAPMGNGWCDGSTPHTDNHSGSLGKIGLGALRARFPAGTSFTGPEPQASVSDGNGRPNTAPHAFTIEVVVHASPGGVAMTGEDRRAAYLHHDADALAGFPRGIRRAQIAAGAPTSDGESSPVLADLNGDNRNELIVGSSDGFVHAIEPNGDELPGWPVRGDIPGFVSHHATARAYSSGEVSTDEGGAFVASLAVGDVNGDGVPEVYAADLEGKVYGWRADGHQVFAAEANPAFSGKPLTPFVNSRHGETNRTQHGFLASPVLADLNGDGKQEIIAASMDRHVYAWNADGSDVPGYPVLVVDPTKVDSVDPSTDQITFKAGSGAYMNGGIVDTPAVADLDGDGKPEIVVGTNEEYAASEDGGWNVAPANTASFNLLDQLGQAIDAFKSACGSSCDDIPDVPLKTANSRVYAIHSDGSAHPGDSDAFLPGWPAKVGIVDAELLPDVGEGVTGYPVIGDSSCNGGAGGPKIGVIANNGAGYVFGTDGSSCYGKSGGQDIPIATDFSASPTQVDHPLVPAVGHPAFADIDGTGLSLIAPAAGLMRALDVALPEYQPSGQDFLSVWSVDGGGQLRPGFPQPVNDLQFLTGPSVSDIDPTIPGQEVLEGTASMDFNAFTAAGAEVPGWPKMSSDWTIANPTVGSFGTLDTQAGSRKLAIGLTRSGYINAFITDAGPCTPSAWPRFHHDNANSGDVQRDATLPGAPYEATSNDTQISFRAPGDDLLCGTADHFEVVTSDSPITASNFDAGDPLTGAPGPSPAGSMRHYTPPAGVKRYVGIRAADEQGNVGRPVSVDFLGPPNPPPPPPPHCANQIIGTPHNDVLRGTKKSDRMRGRAGDDKLIGRGDDDCIAGGPGTDRVRAGGGDDSIHVRGHGHDTVRCGPGEDEVFAGRADKVRKDCETVHRGL
jgi:hypothetical protein